MAYFKWLLAALVGAAVGGAVWIAIGYYTNYEVGYIAWGIGLLAGIGVRSAAGKVEGVGPGAAAVVAAVAIVAVSKFAVVHFQVDKIMNEAFAEGENFEPSEEQRIAGIAYEMAQQQEEQGQPLNWPAGKTLETAETKADFPEEVWAQAKARWDETTPEQRQQQLVEQRQAMRDLQGALKVQIRDQVFKGSFSGFDLLWFGLAAFTAFKVGSGTANENE